MARTAVVLRTGTTRAWATPDDLAVGDTLAVSGRRYVVARGTGWTFSNESVRVPVLTAGGRERWLTVPHELVFPEQ